ncbi:hypothetical protein GCM10020229_81100 [Kitasatospora albolonga]
MARACAGGNIGSRVPCSTSVGAEIPASSPVSPLPAAPARVWFSPARRSRARAYTRRSIASYSAGSNGSSGPCSTRHSGIARRPELPHLPRHPGRRGRGYSHPNGQQSERPSSYEPWV